MTKTYEDIKREIEPLLTKLQNLTELEEYKFKLWAMSAVLVKAHALTEALDEGERRENSTALKDRFLRAVDVGYTTINPQNKKIIARAQEKVAEEHNKKVGEFAARLEEEARIRAVVEAAHRNRAEATAAEAALVLKRAEIEEMAVRAATLDKDMPVSKPANVIKRNARAAAPA
ncbi:MAG: hypothetical protein Q8K65_02505 [Alphaproteobacteria bacterium]|nr:hypothetical protein [Alphaproteobacteria bacterium]